MLLLNGCALYFYLQDSVLLPENRHRWSRHCPETLEFPTKDDFVRIQATAHYLNFVNKSVRVH